VLPVAAATVNLLVAILKSSPRSKSPTTSRSPEVKIVLPTFRYLPTFRSIPIPAPPPTMRAPVEEVTELVVSKILTEPTSRPDLVPENASLELIALWNRA